MQFLPRRRDNLPGPLLLIIYLLLALVSTSAVAQNERQDASLERTQPTVTEVGSDRLTLSISELASPGSPLLFQLDSTRLPEYRFTIALPIDASSIEPRIESEGQRRLFETTIQTDVRPGGTERFVLLGTSQYKGVRLATFAYRPYERTGVRIKGPASARLHISWTSSVSPATNVREESFGPIVRDLKYLVLNYQQALGWIGAIEREKVIRDPKEERATLLSSQSLHAGSGWGLGPDAVVLLVPGTALYRVSGAEIGRGDVQISNLRLTNRDSAVQMTVLDRGGDGFLNTDDFLEFRGERNPGPPGIWLNEITDTNAYVLRFNGGEGLAPVPFGQNSPPPSRLITTYDSTLHFEVEDFWYGGISLPYFGDELTLHVSERVFHERFYWRSANDTRERPLLVNCSPVYSQDGMTTMKIRMVGATYFANDPNSPPQVLNVLVNRIDVGTVSIRDTADTVVSVRFPTNVLVNGENRVSFNLIDNDPHPDRTNNVLIDYIELEGTWNALATNDNGTAVPGSTVSGTSIAIPGFQQSGNYDVDEGSTWRPVDSVRGGHLLRVTSRAGVELRPYSGFTLRIGNEEISSPAPFQLGLMIVEASIGSQGLNVVRQQFFRTENDLTEYDKAATFINQAANGNVVVVGLAFGTNQHNKTPSFITALQGLGSSQVSDRDYFATGGYVAAIKGRPETAVEEYAGGNRGLSANVFLNDADRPTSWRVVAPVSGNGGSEVMVGLPRSLNTRNHDADELIGSENKADLIIITHPLFRGEAERLAQHRRDHDGFDVRVVDIYRVYDEFNSGIKDPEAIRRFLQFADTNWADPKPSYVILFGDASWDSQQRMSRSTMVDYIPSSGVPSTDHIYTVAYGDTTLAPQQFIGRLPALSVNDARAIVDKLIEYDTQPPAEWNKRFVFATGGGNLSERDNLRADALLFASTLAGPPLNAEAIVISRSGTTDAQLKYPSTVDGDRVRSEMNRGALSLDFNGHGSTTVIDLNFGFPEDFENLHHYFILSTWSCQTGLFSNTDETLRNERFLTIPEKGSIASFGGTSFSYTNIDNRLRNHIYLTIVNQPQQRSLGSIYLLAKYEMFGDYAYGGFDLGYRARNHVLEYNLLGDPSTKIALRATPELAVAEGSIRANGESGIEPQLGDQQMEIHAAIWNYGRPLTGAAYDTGVAVRVTLIDPNGVETIRYDTLQRLGRYDSADVTFPLGERPGEYFITVEVDPDRNVTESYLPDNRLSTSFLLRGSQPLALEPLSFGLVENPDDVTIRLLNPVSGPGATFLLDTVPTFDSPGLVSSTTVGTVVERELTTEWKLAIPQGLRAARTFWWRARATTGDPALAEKFPLVESFTVRRDEPDLHVEISGVEQMNRTRVNDLVNEPEGIGPGTRAVPIYVKAVGQTYLVNAPNAPVLNTKFLTVRVGNTDYRRQQVDGFNVLVFEPNDVVPIVDTSFLMQLPGSMGQFEDLIANHVGPEDRVVLASSGVSFQSFDDNFLERLRTVLKGLGSSVADTLTYIDIEASYALIGGKGVGAGKAREAYLLAEPLREDGQVPPFPVEVSDTITAVPRAGSWTSPILGPATSWHTVSFDLASDEPAGIDVRVLGLQRDGSRDTVQSFVVNVGQGPVDLSSISVADYPRIELLVRFNSDTTQRLRDVQVRFDPSPELAIVPSTVMLSSDSVMQGEEVKVTGTIANLTSFQSARNIGVVVTQLGELGGTVDATEVDQINPLDSARVTLTINTSRYQSSRQFVLHANPTDRPSEPYTHNNRTGILNVDVTKDGIPPGYAIYADNSRLMNGDYVAPTADFEIRLFDNSLLQLDSLQTFTLVLDNEWITSAEGGTFDGARKGDVKATFRYQPPTPLAAGEHDIRIFLKDATGNGDTSEIITFYVEPELKIMNVANWPNPFQKETSFTFMLSGETLPESGNISVYTAAGRKIRSIDLTTDQLHVGANTVDWNGLDEDGDELANGVYFYRIRIRAGDSTVEAIEKIAVLR